MQIKSLIKKLIPSFLLDWYHFKLAFLGALFYGFPSRKLTVIGVTGTSGKSTTVDFITRILEEAGHKVVSNSSIRFKIGDKEWENNRKMGMPGRFFIQKLLRAGVNKKCNYAVLEITSEGIRQHRHRFINFAATVFTNLTPEHIESHGGFENYRNEKLKLFKATKNIHIINSDDPNASYFLKIPAKKIYTFGLQLTKDTAQKEMVSRWTSQINWNKNNHLQAQQVIGDADGIGFLVQDVPFHLNVLGNFNAYNALAAISVARSQNISLEICKRALEKVGGIAGRMEVVAKHPLVIVDYAHTPEQLEQAYASLAGKKLICVLGSCGGGRDKWKRPVLGTIAQKYCHQIILTNEDPYDENPLSIMEEIESGFSQITNPKSQITNKSEIQNPKYEKILDRKEAIKKALELVKPEDAVIITGKGSEPWMCIAGGKKIPWSDKEIVKETLPSLS